MGKEVRVQELMGVGTRYDIGCGAGRQHVSVIVHKDGHRELYAFERPGDEPTAVMSLSEEQARQLGAVLTGTYFSD